MRPIKPKEMAKRCGIKRWNDLQRWDREEGYLKAHRTITNVDTIRRTN